MPSNKQKKGSQYEQLALNYLLQQKLKQIEQNYFCKWGEIDLIMQDKDFIVFVEVKYRKKTQYGHPLETITRSKQLKIKKTALLYLQKKNINNAFCRFDAISIDNNNEITWIKSAFT
jgi:putative endonuclease